MAAREEITLYTRPGCSLCDKMKAGLHDRGYRVREVNIDDDPELTRRYGWISRWRSARTERFWRSIAFPRCEASRGNEPRLRCRPVRRERQPRVSANARVNSAGIPPVCRKTTVSVGGISPARTCWIRAENPFDV